MLTTLHKIQKERWYAGQEVPQYLLTHPGAPERMASIETMLQGYRKPPDPDKARDLRSRFPFFHTAVLALCHDKEDATRTFEKILRADPDSPMAHYGLGLISEREGKTDQALDYFKKALAHQPDSVPVMFSLGNAYQVKGEYEPSVSVLTKALELSPKDKGVMYLLAFAFQNLELYDKASKIYERLTFLPPVKEEVYYNLGLIYGRQNKLALAHYNLGIYFTKLRRREKALFHFEKARDFQESAPGLKEKIDKALSDVKSY